MTPQNKRNILRIIFCIVYFVCFDIFAVIILGSAKEGDLKKLMINVLGTFILTGIGTFIVSSLYINSLYVYDDLPNLIPVKYPFKDHTSDECDEPPELHTIPNTDIDKPKDLRSL